MNATREALTRSIDATRAVLNALTPSQLDQVLEQTRAELAAFIKNEWLPLNAEDRRTS